MDRLAAMIELPAKYRPMWPSTALVKSNVVETIAFLMGIIDLLTNFNPLIQEHICRIKTDRDT
jgi:hypothetical protein